MSRWGTKMDAFIQHPNKKSRWAPKQIEVAEQTVEQYDTVVDKQPLMRYDTEEDEQAVEQYNTVVDKQPPMQYGAEEDGQAVEQYNTVVDKQPSIQIDAEEDEQAVEQANETILEQNKDTFINMIGVITKLFECGSVRDYSGYCLI